MSDYTEMAALGMAPLRHNVRVRVLSVHDAQTVPATLVQRSAHSPFFFAAGQQFFVTSKTESDLALALEQRQLALAAIHSAGGAATMNTQGIRVQLTLPEMALGDSYAALAQAGKMPSYLTYRNQIYLRLAAKLSATTGLFSLLGAQVPQSAGPDWSDLQTYAATFKARGVGEQLGTVGLVGEHFEQRGVLAVEIDVPLLVGINVTALRLLRDTFWALLDADRAPTDLLAYLRSFYGADYALPQLNAVVSALPQDNAHLLLQACIAAGGDMQQASPQTPLYQLCVGKQEALIGAAGLGLNSDVATELSRDRFARRNVLAAAGIKTPLAGVYPDADTLMHDWQGSFRDKAIVLKSRQQGDAVSEVILSTPQADQLRAKIAALAGELQVETYQSGDVFRLLVLQGRVLAVLAIDYAYVVGDGRSQVQTLLQRRNQQNAQLGYPQLPMDARVQEYLRLQGVTADTIVGRGSQVYLGRNSMALAAGSYRNGSDELDSSYQQVAITAAAALHLDLCSVDLAVVNSYVPLDPQQDQQVSVVGVNANPELRTFETPTYGDPQHVLTPVLQAVLK